MGESRNLSRTLPTRYTPGQYSHASDFRLVFYGSRFYDPSIMQFNQPDTLVPDPYNPLDYNRYAYARYNPLRYSDPSGHSIWDAIGQFATGFVYEVARTTAWYSPHAQNILSVNAAESDAMLAGRIVADIATIALGVTEVAGGITMSTAGTAVSCAATLCTAAVMTVGTGAIAVGAGATTTLAGAAGLGGNLALLAGSQGSGGPTNQRRYTPSPKHASNSGWGSPMDLGDDIAQDVLNGGIQYGKQV